MPPNASPPLPVPPTDTSEPSDAACDHRERDETEISLPASVDDPRSVINTNQWAKEDGNIDEKGETSENPPGVVGKNMEIRRMSTTDEGDKVLRSAWDSPEKVSIASNCIDKLLVNFD